MTWKLFLGKKLPILFILKGMPNGPIALQELPMYPRGHYYTVQKNAWMDSVCWEYYVKNVLQYELDGPALLLADNFDCHVSQEGKDVLAAHANAQLYPLPPNSTSTCQPLDVGVMGPLKSKIRRLSLTNRGPTPTTAKEKRIAAVKRTIETWNGLDEKAAIARSFEKAIPREFEALTLL